MNLAALGMNENLEENKNEKPFVGPKSPEASAEVDILAVDDKALHKSIQQLVTDGRLDEAECEVKAALEKSPDSESVLVLGSLVAMSEQRWDDAASRLITLLKVQGENAPAMTHLMMIRTLRCQDKHLEAMEAAMFAVKTHYDDMEIVEEAASVAEYLNEWESAVLALDVLVESHGDNVPRELVTRWDTAKLMALAFGMSEKAEFKPVNMRKE